MCTFLNIHLIETLGFLASFRKTSVLASHHVSIQNLSLFFIVPLLALVHKDDQGIAVIIWACRGRSRRCIVRQREGQRRWDIVSLSEPLQPLQLVHGLEELAIYRGLIVHESIDRSALKRAGFREIRRFMESGYTDPPVFVRNLLHQNFFQRADRFPVQLILLALEVAVPMIN
jgi:hypothetical protein